MQKTLYRRASVCYTVGRENKRYNMTPHMSQSPSDDLTNLKPPAVQPGHDQVRTTVRDYDDVLNRIRSLGANNPQVQIHHLGVLTYGDSSYEFKRLVVGSNAPDSIKVLVSAGVHGDEPAGVHALLDFLEKHASQYLDRFTFVVYPCINPSGFELDTRKTAADVDLNRSFGKVGAPEEIRLIEADLRALGHKYAFALDMHEDRPEVHSDCVPLNGGPVRTDADGCYLYESQNNPLARMGQKMIAALPSNIPVCRSGDLYGDHCENGVIQFSASSTGNAAYADNSSFDGYLNGSFTDHSFTTETLGNWYMDLRVEVQTAFLKAALEEIRNRPS
jgi:murein peptide amidase A